ncbi:MAG TPA: DUF4124 domain-containing protein [Nitrospirota bacterium]|nr:DUF4124 domain-containing protein [Nitrospirota bacterium]
MLRFVALAACIFLFSASSARADFYRWQDKDGKEFFTNDPRQIPQKYRNRASKIRFEASRVSVEERSAAPGKMPVKTTRAKTAEERRSGEPARKNTGIN